MQITQELLNADLRVTGLYVKNLDKTEVLVNATLNVKLSENELKHNFCPNYLGKYLDH